MPKGPEKVLKLMDKHQWKLLHFAAHTDWPDETIKLLMKVCLIPNPSKVDLVDLAKSLDWPYDMVKKVLTNVENVNHLDKHQRTALHLAANRDNYRFIRSLIKYPKLAVDAPDSKGMTALHYAAKKGHSRVLTMLCLAKANGNAKTNSAGNKTPAHLACMEGHVAAVRILHNHAKADLLMTTKAGKSCLHLAAGANNSNSAKTIAYLMENTKFTVNEKDASGSAAIHYAAECGSLDNVRCLVEEYKADLNLQDKCGQTPMHVAAFNGSFHIIQYLAEQGADVKKQDEDGISIMQYAKDEKHLKIVRFLKERLNMEINDSDQDPESADEEFDSDSSDSSSDSSDEE